MRGHFVVEGETISVESHALHAGRRRDHPYGIDPPVRQDLIAATHSTEEIATYVTADSLGYLSVEGLAQAVGDPAWKSYCNACFTGNYLTPLETPQAAPATG